MKAGVFLDAFSEVLVGISMTKRTPTMRYIFRELTAHNVASRHGAQHADATRIMFDRLWADMQSPGATK